MKSKLLLLIFPLLIAADLPKVVVPGTTIPIIMREDFARADGQDGRPAYILHSGNVYNAAQSPAWERFSAVLSCVPGTDVTSRITRSMTNELMLIKSLPVAGRLAKRYYSAAEAAGCTGGDGQPACIIVDNVVFEIRDMRRFSAVSKPSCALCHSTDAPGSDFSERLKSDTHHGIGILKRMTIAGIITN
ncbi:MAG: hypothetical protein HZC28_01315 [Spirochaetes bacterium]|nr:hypothetical protein [Spirochaetota bacterium]